MTPEQLFYLWAAFRTGRTSEIIEQRCAHNTEWRNMREAYIAGRAAASSSQETEPAPNDAFRWICVHCTTVNSNLVTTCDSCARERYPSLNR